MKKAFLFTILSWSMMTTFAQSFDGEKLDSLFQILEANDKFMGSLAVTHQGKVIYSNAIGFADLETEKKVDTNSKYRIGSISKTFTATLVMKAHEEGKLKLSQTIDGFFPQIKYADKITISNLLNHRSGIFNVTNVEDYLEWNTEFQSKEKMIERIVAAGNDFEPDEKADYSNSNYILLSYLLEEVYQKPFGEILQEKIIQPLELKNTYYGGKTDLKKNETNSYRYTGAWEKEVETDMSIPLGAGAIVSTATDLNTFFVGLFGEKIIAKESLEKMKILQDDFGMGLFTFPYHEKTAYGHTGGIDGFQSMAGYFPEDELAVAVVSNGLVYSNNDVILTALHTFYGNDFDLPDFKTLDLTVADLEKYLGVYASVQIPIKITISQEGTTLIAQATGQSSFPLDATDVNVFKFDAAGIVLEFNPEKKEMILKQGGGIFTFMKEE